MGRSAKAAAAETGHGTVPRKASSAGKGRAAGRKGKPASLDHLAGPPTFAMEAEAIATGVGPICGIDEAGRGPLCGPVVVAAVILDPARIPRGLDDSKKLTAARRAELLEEILDTAEIAVVQASSARIDRDNIRSATLWAMARAVDALPRRPGLALIDGCDTPPRIGVPSRCVVKGDALVLSIAAASIVAKVMRDRLMMQAGLLHPGYGFERHMGYSTAEHIEAIAQLGPCSLHRRSFWRIAAAYEQQGDLNLDRQKARGSPQA